MYRSVHRAFYQIPLVLFSSLISFTVGSLCIALVATYHQEETVLIVIACSTILYGISSLPLTLILRNAHSQFLFLKFPCILFQLTTLGASIEYFNRTTKRAIENDTYRHKNLLIGLDSLLLCSFLANGFALGCTRGPVGDLQETKDLESHEPKAFVTNLDDKIEQYVPMKHSAQTLIPEIDALRNLRQTPSWNVGQDSAMQLRGTESMSSVVQHKLQSMDLPRAATSEDNTKAKLPNLKALMTSPKLKRSFVFKFNSPKALARRNGFGLRKRKNSTLWERENRNRSVSSRNTGRLSTIPDLSHSVLNYSGTSLNSKSGHRFDKSADSVIDPSHFRGLRKRASSAPTIELERNAIERINSALLPPCLKISEPLTASSSVPMLDFPLRALSPVTSDVSADNSIERNDLEDIPQVPQLPDETASNFLAEQDKPNMDIPLNVTLDRWEKNKENFLKRAATMQEHNNRSGCNNNGNLLPALQFESEQKPPVLEIPDLQTKDNFSFPVQKPLEVQTKFEDNNYDTISALEQYFSDIDEEEQREGINIEDGFQYHNKSPSFHSQRFSKDLQRNSIKHSPTKSLISMISGRESLVGHQRSQTLLVNNNINNNNSDGSPTKSSPSRSQRLKRMGKKLSLSNISDTMINITGNTENGNEFRSPFKDGRVRGKSVDFSYIYNLQSNHSPTKSTSGISSNHGSIYKDRRNSVATEKSMGKGVSGFQLANANATSNATSNANANTNANTTADAKVAEAIVECRTPPPPNRIPSTESSQVSAASTTNYPDIVMSEYDRERWNTLLSLQLINSKGQFNTG